MIELSSQDVIRLYGRYLFVIPNEGKQIGKVLPDVIPEKIAETPPPVKETPVPVAETPAPPVEKPLPTETKQEEVLATPELTTGTQVVWKMKTQSRIAMVIDETAFKNRAMTLILKDCVERAGMSTDLIGFGILKTGESSFDFTQQPVPFALAFSPGLSDSKSIQLPGGQEVYLMPTLADIIMNQEKQEALISLLKQLNERL